MQQENNSSNNDLFGDLTFDHTARQYIRSIAGWAMVIVVVALISYAIALIQSFTTPEVAAVRSEGFDFGLKTTRADKTWTIIPILFGLLLNFFLFRFATQAKTGVNGLNQAALNKSFNSLKIYFMITVILSILAFVFVLGLTMLAKI
jgi:hypothetical protein